MIQASSSTEPKKVDYTSDKIEPHLPHLLDDPDDLSYEESGSDAIVQTLREAESEDASDASSFYEGSPERPNRFKGSRRAWFALTTRERQEATALETIQSQDLSIHLFNAFSLKQRAGHIKEIRASGNWDNFARDNGFREDLLSTFAPAKTWTAWPERAIYVPRPDEMLAKADDEYWTIRQAPDARPSADLEEHIMAMMLKSAKERFQSRKFSPSRSLEGTPDTLSELESLVSHKREDDGIDDIEGGCYLRPVVQADDDQARRLLRPEARHVISKLDELLLSLYKSRETYLTAADLASCEGNGDEMTRHGRRCKRGSQSKTTSGTTTPQGTSSPYSNTIDELAENAADVPQARKRRKRAAPRRARLGLRDWSDILGVASMIGWPKAAVMRTARRCADLFKEDMLFRTFNEGNLQLEIDNSGSPSWAFVEHEEHNDNGKHASPDCIGKHKEMPFVCPVEECRRHRFGFSRKWNLDQHIQNKHPQVPIDSRPRRKRRRISRELSAQYIPV
ncbi:hypothetical protein LOZ57_001557 [Ophidiomyces ophidiicola]|uniref:uncharacterized protein n=1 Tax=Ophidiomyces ophidiicola TaxID=1387563 RepID=UPI0020C4EB08|nr:uncharacterized protein LOZ57_001557 [Ophidiomyces ophidiicola]KAI1951008.1 hypothetical protein LOZ57_001557 [Ophidiomyces ophidiicola]KAI2060950.1 hypothetical protein LOZ43_001406 [Ophidiomyces ophidiicola]